MFNIATAAPLYAQIAVRLRAQIAAGEYARGARIPSEHELATRFSVGRPTVRQATDILVRDRVLLRRRGAGTFVADEPAEVDLFSVAGTIASFRERGITPKTRIVGKVSRVPAPKEAPERLAGQPAFYVARVSSVRNEPVLFEKMYFEAKSFPGLDRVGLAGQSLSELSRSRYMLTPSYVQQKFRVVPADAASARHLGVKTKAPLLLVERAIDFEKTPAAVFSQNYYVTDRVVFTQVVPVDGRRVSK